MTSTSTTVKQVARRYWPLGFACLGLVAVAIGWAVAPASDWIDALTRGVAALGLAAPVVYLVLYTVGAIVLAPSPVMSIAAGIAFGWWGFPLALIGATLGATGSFLLSRYFLRDTLDDWLTERATLRAAKTAVDEEGWKALILLRLTPAVPFGILNYLLGFTKTSLPAYVLCTMIGIVPGTLVDIYIGVIGAEAAQGAKLAYLIAGLCATALIAVAITLKARSYLRAEGIHL